MPLLLDRNNKNPRFRPGNCTLTGLVALVRLYARIAAP
jgi:hypothetical protein